MTMKYSHLSPEHKRAAINRLNRISVQKQDEPVSMTRTL